MATSDGSGPVQNHTSKPPGVLPKHMQAWLIGGLALAMTVVIAFSNRTPVKREKAAPVPVVDAREPSAPRIDDYRDVLDQETQRLYAEQMKLRSAQSGIDAARGGIALPNDGAPTTGPFRGDYAAPPERSWMELDLEKRNYQSRYAPNVVHSKRPREDLAQATAILGKPLATSLLAGGDQPPDPSAKPKTYRLPEGTVLESVLTNRLDSTFSGPVNAQVTTNVYSSDRTKLLIPQGSRVLGSVTRVDAFNQQRLAVTFERLNLPNGEAINLQSLPGLSQVGETGLLDKIDHHYTHIFGVSLAIGAIAGLSQAGTTYGPSASAGDVYRQGVANSLSQTSMNVLDRFLNVVPTFTVREGTRIKVYLTSDLDLPAYGDRFENTSQRSLP
jgi:type IV secretory pathway VirB10-like protein